MSLFDSFKTVNVSASTPSFSITRNGITFNKSVLDILNLPDHVVVLLSEETKQMAIKKADINQQNAQAFLHGKQLGATNVRWNYKNFTLSLSKMMNWDLDKVKGYTIPGQYIASETAILFDFTKALSI